MAKDKPLQRIARGIKRRGTKGAFKRKAKRAGMSTAAYAEKERNAPGRTGKQARLALVFARARKGKRKAKRARKRTSHR